MAVTLLVIGDRNDPRVRLTLCLPRSDHQSRGVCGDALGEYVVAAMLFVKNLARRRDAQTPRACERVPAHRRRRELSTANSHVARVAGSLERTPRAPACDGQSEPQVEPEGQMRR